MPPAYSPAAVRVFSASSSAYESAGRPGASRAARSSTPRLKHCAAHPPTPPLSMQAPSLRSTEPDPQRTPSSAARPHAPRRRRESAAGPCRAPGSSLRSPAVAPRPAVAVRDAGSPAERRQRPGQSSSRQRSPARKCSHRSSSATRCAGVQSRRAGSAKWNTLGRELPATLIPGSSRNCCHMYRSVGSAAASSATHGQRPIDRRRVTDDAQRQKLVPRCMCARTTPDRPPQAAETRSIGSNIQREVCAKSASARRPRSSSTCSGPHRSSSAW